jgi:hypothetical protein
LKLFTNYAHSEQLNLLQHFNENQVKYLVFGDFAINTFEKDRPTTHMKVWFVCQYFTINFIRKFWDATALEKAAEQFQLNLRSNYQTQSGIPVTVTAFKKLPPPDKRDFDSLRKELDIEVV